MSIYQLYPNADFHFHFHIVYQINYSISSFPIAPGFLKNNGYILFGGVGKAKMVRERQLMMLLLKLRQLKITLH